MSAELSAVELEIVYLHPDDLTPNPRNSKVHPEAQLRAIEQTVKRVGFVVPIRHADRVILAGHGGHVVAKRLGLTRVPTVDLSHLTEEERRAYMIADNALGERSRWDEEMLKSEVRFLADSGFDEAALGLAQHDLDRILRPDFHAGDQLAPEAPKRPRARAGDTWLLGVHRVRCGDSTNADDVAQLLAGAEPHLMVTDPPYGVNYDPNWRNEAARTSKGMGNRALGAGAVGKVSNDDRDDWRAAWQLFPGAVAYVWHGGLHGLSVAASLEASGFKLRAQIIWNKGRHIISRGDYHWAHEPAFYAERDGVDPQWNGGGDGPFDGEHEEASYAVRKGEKGSWSGGRRQSTVWDIPHMISETGHGTQKPMECMRRPILNNSRRGDAVYDPFLGSGTTLCAAEQTGRRCFGMELDPAYVDVVILRWQEMFAGAAVREADGVAFNDVPLEVEEAEA